MLLYALTISLSAFLLFEVQPIIAKINGAMNELLHAPDIAQHLERLGMQPVGGSPADMAAFVHEETRRWGEVIKAANIRAD